jgi:hypothetical protein
VLGLKSRTAQRVPMMAWSAACGFPSPAEDYVDRPLDFNELLIEHPAATFVIRIAPASSPVTSPSSTAPANPSTVASYSHCWMAPSP